MDREDTLKPRLTDEDELTLITMVRGRMPCEWAQMAAKLYILCDTICPCRRLVIEEYERILRDRHNDDMEKEFPDG